ATAPAVLTIATTCTPHATPGANPSSRAAPKGVSMPANWMRPEAYIAPDSGSARRYACQDSQPNSQTDSPANPPTPANAPANAVHRRPAPSATGASSPKCGL